MDKTLLMAEHRALFGDNKFRSISKEYYEWKICKNPAAEGHIGFEMRDGKVVGSSALMPRKVGILDEIFLAGETADSFTLPNYRKQGINSRVLKSCVDYAVSKGMNLVYGPPNRANYGLHIKMGYLPCHFAGYNFMTKSLNPPFFITKLFFKIFLLKNVHRNYQYLKYLLKNAVSKGKNIHLYENVFKDHYQITKIASFDEQVDPLWGKPRYSFFILRDSRYLNWRYFENPDEFTVLAAHKEKRCLGYIALKMSKDGRTGVLCDFITLNDRLDIFAALVSESENYFRRQGAEMIQLSCIKDSPYCQALSELGYYDHGEESYQPILIYSKTDLGRRVLETPGRWHFTLGDTDEV